MASTFADGNLAGYDGKRFHNRVNCKLKVEDDWLREVTRAARNVAIYFGFKRVQASDIIKCMSAKIYSQAIKDLFGKKEPFHLLILLFVS
jgi:hypothetical protein